MYGKISSMYWKTFGCELGVQEICGAWKAKWNNFRQMVDVFDENVGMLLYSLR